MMQPESAAPLGALKRKIYLVVWPFGVVATILCWMARAGNTPVERWLYPLLGLCFIALAAMLLWWKDARSLRVIERFLFGIVALSLLARFYDVLWAQPFVEASPTVASLLYWFPLAYVLAHIAFDARGNLVSLAFFAATLAPGLARILPDITAGDIGASLDLMKFYLANVVYIALLFAVAALRQQYARTVTQAETMAQLAYTDAVTGMSNRMHLNGLLAKELERARRFKREFSVILFDLDHFKNVNDTHGHDAGDDVLRETARTVREHLRPSDELGRWGGDEFLILTPESDAASSRQLAERLRQVVAGHAAHASDPITASFGVATYREGEDAEGLVKLADEALYRAKRAGRNRVEAFVR
jgi:diguanylate cyclase